MRIIALARRPLPRIEFLRLVERRCRAQIAPHDFSDEAWHRFSTRLDYFSMDATQSADFGRLARLLGEPGGLTRVHYLATAPQPVRAHRRAPGRPPAWPAPDTRIVLEKPIGHSLESALAISEAIGKVSTRSQAFRIDHYLGKETVQNLMALRFANALFEPVWRAGHIDHVQISVYETLGVENRGAYYDQRRGHARHAAEPPAAAALPGGHGGAGALRRRVGARREGADPPGAASRITVWTCRTRPCAASTAAARIGGQEVPAYYFEKERGQRQRHRNLRRRCSAEIDNWRWAGVPFYLRTGKRLASKCSRNRHPVQAGAPAACSTDDQANCLLIRLQPESASACS